MKQSQNQKINIIINNEVKKTKKKRKYVKKQKEEIINNPQLTAYNPNVLSKTSSVPSYGLKSVNPVLDSTLGLTTSLLLDKLKQPEPSKEQYSQFLQNSTLPTNIKEEQTKTYFQEEFKTPIRKNNINEFSIDDFSPNTQAFNEMKEIKEIPSAKGRLTIFNPQKPDDFGSPLQIFNPNFMDTKQRKPGRPPLDINEYKTENQIKNRIAYIRRNHLTIPNFELEMSILENKLKEFKSTSV